LRWLTAALVGLGAERVQLLLLVLWAGQGMSSSAMRLALIGPVYPYRGGIAHYTTRLAQAIRQRGHDLLLVSFSRQYPQWLFPGKSDKDSSQKPIEAGEAQYWIDSINPLTWLSTFWRIRSFRPDGIILQWWTTYWALAWFLLMALFHGFLHCPVIVICHNVLPHEARWWDPWLVRLVLRWGALLTTQSAEEREKLLGLLPGAHVEICPHPVYDFLSDQQTSRETARSQLSLPAGVPILLCFGVVRPYKGLRDLLMALPAVRAELAQVLLVVAGEFWEDKQSYSELVRQLGVEESVLIDDRYIPNEEVALLFSAADLLVAPYREVTGSGSVQMARGLGLPVVTTRVGDMAEAVRGQAALLVPPADPEALAAGIIHHFTSNPEAAPPVAPGGDSFTWDQLVTIIETAVRGDAA
ncbi:glycosyltransferase, partial [Chloroflexota bacterium]